MAKRKKTEGPESSTMDIVTYVRRHEDDISPTIGAMLTDVYRGRIMDESDWRKLVDQAMTRRV